MFDPPLGRDAARARRALLAASDDALGVHRRSFVRRLTLFFTVVILLAFAATLVYLAHQTNGIAGLVSTRLDDVSMVRALADGKPVSAGAVVSFTASGVQQGFGPAVGDAVSSLPCDGARRVHFIGNASLVSVAVLSPSLLAYWMVNSSLGHTIVANATINTTAADAPSPSVAAIAAHVAIAGIGHASGPLLVLTGAARGGSSVSLHVVPGGVGGGAVRSRQLAPFFTSSSASPDLGDRGSGFFAALPGATAGVVVGYPCGDGVCCVDALSWAGDLLATGPRLDIPRCPSHVVLHEDSLLVLPTLPVIVIAVNATGASMRLSQVLRLPASLRAVGNSSSDRVRVAAIPTTHAKRSVLIAVALHDTVLVYQALVTRVSAGASSSSSSSSSSSVVLVPQLYATLRTGLAGPLLLDGLVFAATESWATVILRDANELHYAMQVSFVVSGGDASPAMLLPHIGASGVEFVWRSDVWRHTMLLVRDSTSRCSLRSVDWQGGLAFAGVAANTVAAGGAVDVLTGGIVRVFAGLLPGAVYAVGVNGTVVQMHDPLALTSSRSRAIGRALSATELFLFPSQ